MYQKEFSMQDNRKPSPLFRTALGKECPICHKKTYSKAGIHPQCAVIQADAPRQLRLKAMKRAEKQQLERSKAAPRQS